VSRFGVFTDRTLQGKFLFLFHRTSLPGFESSLVSRTQAPMVSFKPNPKCRLCTLFVFGSDKMSDPMKSKEQSFYLDLSENPPTAGFNSLLENYSKVPKEEIYRHIEKVVRSLPFQASVYLPTISNCYSVMKLGSIIRIPQSASMSSTILGLAGMTFQRTISTLPKLSRPHIKTSYND
jgi:hypothetical protein